jgi:hypothetical protein
MEKYMGYRANEGPIDTERELPIKEIDGTAFLVDIKAMELRQVDDPFNRISIGDVAEESGFKVLLYDPATKNIYPYKDSQKGVPPNVKIIIVPPLKDLDPIGLARRQGYSDQYYLGNKNVDKPRIQVSSFSVKERERISRRKKSIGL